MRRVRSIGPLSRARLTPPDKYFSTGLLQSGLEHVASLREYPLPIPLCLKFATHYRSR